MGGCSSVLDDDEKMNRPITTPDVERAAKTSPSAIAPLAHVHSTFCDKYILVRF
jgi:hypothetical protein